MSIGWLENKICIQWGIRMVIKFTEVHENTKAHSNEKERNYSLREVFINPEQVVCIRPDKKFRRALEEGLLPKDMDERQEFTRIYLNRGQVGLDVVVVGQAALIEQKLNNNKKLLKG